MSAVKNLRAMFENKGDASPTDEDRALSGSPRPLNKVRSSFVAIERNGVIGLMRDNGSASRDSSARPSLDIPRELAPTSQDKPPMSSASVASMSSAMDKLSAGVARASFELRGAVSDQPSHNPDKVMDEETPTGILSPADPLTAKAEAEPESAPESSPESAPESAPENAPEAVPAPEAEPEKPAPKEAAPASGARLAAQKTTKTTKPAATKTLPKPVATKSATTTTRTAATRTAAAAAPKPAARAIPKPAATATKATTDASRRAGVRPTQRTAESSAVKRESSAAARSTATARPRGGAATSAVRKPLASKAADNGSAAARARTKSPTKPVGLPSSLIAPTASSVSKTGAAGTNQARQTSSRQGVHASGRATSSAGSAKRPTSRARPSIGPPPVKATREAPKKAKDVDEGFLARMMRPTQASTSKFQEPTTPPKKSGSRAGSRPSTAGTVASGASDGSHYDNSPSKKTSPKRLVGKKSPSPTLEEEKPVAEIKETAEEPVEEVAHEENAAIQPAEPEALPVEEAAVETANVETAEEVVAIAEEAELTEAAPETVPETVEAAEVKAEETPAVESAVEAVAEPEVASVEAPIEQASETVEEPKEQVAETAVPETY
ncbi:hypothetical protein ACHAPX_005338 [Trichoderma viride]